MTDSMHDRWDVRAAAEHVIAAAQQVRIDEGAIDRWADVVDPAAIGPAAYPPVLGFHGSPDDAAQWTLMVDCLNFCFWAESGELWTVEYQGRPWQRYFALLAALRRAVDRDPGWLSPGRWAGASPAEVETLFAGRGRIPLLDERVRILNETGRVTLSEYGGRAMNLAAAAGFDAVRIAAGLAERFESFRDVHRYGGREVPLLKRAQIFAADLAAAWKRSNGPTVTNLEGLTAFADYRLPQILRHLGIMVVEAELESRIEAGRLIESSSPEEIELRACTIGAVERMCRALRRRRGVEVPAWMVDDHLWERSHDPEVRLQHHRTRTWYY